MNLLPTLTTNGSLVDTAWVRAARNIFARSIPTNLNRRAGNTYRVMGREKSNSKGLENKFVIASGFFDVAEYGEQGLYTICVKFAYKKHDLNETKTLDFWYFGSYNKTRFIEYSFFVRGQLF